MNKSPFDFHMNLDEQIEMLLFEKKTITPLISAETDEAIIVEECFLELDRHDGDVG